MEKEIDRLHPLKEEELEMIHEMTLEILSETGMWFESAKARAIFQRHGLTVQGEIVHFNRQIIEDSLKTAPGEFTVLAPNPKNNIHLGGEHYAFSPSGGSAYILDYDGRPRFALQEDYINSLKLTQMLDGVDLNMELIAASDMPADQPLLKVLSAIRYTDKAINEVDLGGGGLLSILFGVEQKKMQEDASAGTAYGLRFINPVSPLGLSAAESDRLIELCDSGIAIAISAMPIAGMTAPCTLPGLLIAQNAEIIGTLVLSQLVNPGCPVLYGCIGTVANMRNASAPIGTPETRIIEMASSQIALFYGLPTRGNAGLTDSNSVDFQAGAESAFQFAASARGGINLLSGLGAMGSWNIGSLEKLVLDAQMADYMRRFFKPLEFTRETMAVDVIKKVGPRGQFVAEEHTFDHFRQEFYDPFVFSRTPYDIWQKEGKKEALERAHDKVLQLIERYRQPDLGTSIVKDMETYVKNYYTA